MSIPVSVANLSLEGKVAIVTGGGTGIGQGIALEFAKVGADVVVASRRLNLLEEVAEQIRALGRRSLAVQTDITKNADVDNLVQRTVDEFGGIDILVNNAGYFDYSPISLCDSDEARWDKLIDINLKGAFLCCRVASKRMIERKKGNIINISSIDGLRASSECHIYAIAKAGVIMLTKGLAWDLGQYNIRANAIAPGSIQTDMMSPELLSNPEALKQKEDNILLHRIGQPTDIGTVALFLASEASNYITGQTIVVDAGLKRLSL